MWEAIAYVSSGLTLAAFVAAVAAWILKGKSEEKANLISLADSAAKVRLVQDALEFFHVDTKFLSPKQQLEVALEQISNRAERFRIIAFLIGFLAVVAASLSAYAISQNNIPRPKDSVSFSIPSGWTFSDVAMAIAQQNNMNIKFSNCSDAAKNTIINPGSIQADNIVFLIEALSSRFIDRAISYKVISLSDRGIYEILCD